MIGAEPRVLKGNDVGVRRPGVEGSVEVGPNTINGEHREILDQRREKDRVDMHGFEEISEYSCSN